VFDLLLCILALAQTGTSMKQIDASLSTYYSARAAEYDSIYQKPERQRDLREIEAWVEAEFANTDVLEIACGTGYWTQFIARSARSVLAFDLADESMNIARARVNLPHVQFVRGDAYAPPVSGRKHKAAFAGFWFSHIPVSRRLAFARTLVNHLSTDAQIVLLDNRYVEGSSTPLDGRDDEGNTYQLRRLNDGSTHRVIKTFPTQEELRLLLQPLAARIDYHQWEHYWAVTATCC
jgi:trans-aconitate methyltransferase